MYVCMYVCMYELSVCMQRYVVHVLIAHAQYACTLHHHYQRLSAHAQIPRYIVKVVIYAEGQG